VLSHETRESLHEKLKGNRWTAGVNSDGYPKMKVEGKSRLASHVLLESLGREVPAGKVVMHRDNNPLNLDPANLRVGTQQQNLKQMRDEGRDRPRGVKQEPDVKKVALFKDFWRKWAAAGGGGGRPATIYLPPEQVAGVVPHVSNLQEYNPNLHQQQNPGHFMEGPRSAGLRGQGMADLPPATLRKLQGIATHSGMSLEMTNNLLRGAVPQGTSYDAFLDSHGKSIGARMPAPPPAPAPPPLRKGNWQSLIQQANAAAPPAPAQVTIDVPRPTAPLPTSGQPSAPAMTPPGGMAAVPRPRPQFQPINPSPMTAGRSAGSAPLPLAGRPSAPMGGLRGLVAKR